MKIAKLTWLYNGNYGSVLQALALQKFLEDNGYDVEDLNYKASTMTKLINWFTNHNSMELILGKYKDARKRKEIKDFEKFELRNRRFEEFKINNMKLSKLCKNPIDLKKIASNYDKFICGSDQIWSPALMNPIFYFSFVEDEKTKISYAPSFGVVKTTKSKEKRIAKLLRRFNHISVREEQGREIVKNLIGIDVPVQVDPTMLISGEKWERYIDDSPIVEDKYIFCYLLTPNKEYIENIKEFSKKNNMKVVIVPTIKGPFETGFEEIPEAGPSEWLNLIKNASYVFTDSFHGCIFSTIFHKEVFLYKRFSDKSKKSENSRIYTLTKWLGIEERLIDEENLNSIFEIEKLNYSDIDKKIEFKAKESANWLINVLNESE